jgi:Cu2+-exporting ATPase
MSADKCTLCDLPTPDPPITDPEAEGTFCCQGCLHVHELLQELDTEQAERVRRETINRKHREWEAQAEEPPDKAEQAFLKVDGMHCSTCESFIEAMARQQDGIYKSEASYASEMVKVYYDPDRLSKEELPDLISKMGYRARLRGSDLGDEKSNTTIRLILGTIFSLYGLIVYILVLYPLYLTGDFVIPFAPEVRYFFLANVWAMTSIVLFFTGWPILRGAWVSVSVLKPNMDLLISIAALSAYLFSTVALSMGLNELYFDVTMAIIIAVSFGNYYENRIKKDKNSLLSALMENRIKQARVRRNGSFEMMEIDELVPQDEVLVKAGERIPVDGTIVKGKGVVNEALITGESLPVSKEPGDRAMSGTVLTQNALTIQTDQQVQSTIENMIRLMWDIQASRPGKQRLADKIAAWFVPGVLLLGFLTFVFYLISGSAASSALLTALSVLIVSCPCALGLATPLAVASGLRGAFKNNIIFKSGAVFEEQSDSDILAFDKTGTLTTGNMRLLDEGNSLQALEYARALERYSSHPVGKAIAGESNNGIEVDQFQHTSRGVSGKIGGKTIYVGQPEWLREKGCWMTSKQWSRITRARRHGYVPTGVGWDEQVQGLLIVGDRIREEAENFIQSLKQQDKKIAIITGDSEEAARPIRQKLQPDFLFTEARPESKTEIIKNLKEKGSVTMIGDGSNDALALADADLGIAFGDLTAIAADSAQIVIPENNLKKIVTAFIAVEQTKKRIRQNLGWAFLYNATAIPLAIAGLINPLFAAIAMAGSSLLVVANSSRKMKFEPVS